MTDESARTWRAVSPGNAVERVSPCEVLRPLAHNDLFISGEDVILAGEGCT